MTNQKAILLATVFATAAMASDFHVGPGQSYSALGQVPWYSLAPGDTVYVHYQPAAYHEKILISSRGTASQWIRVLGVPGVNGELPVISGDGATTSTNMHYYWQDATGSSAIQNSGVIQIAYRSDPSRPKPGYIEIAGLQVQDASSAYSFTAENGTPGAFGDFAACIYSRSADHVLVRNNVLTNCGLGFYNWTGSSPTDIQTDTVVSGNYFYSNGIPNAYLEHQVYIESLGSTIEYNHFGPMKPNALGSQVKDRSAGTIVRYNYIEQSLGWLIDLVEAQNGAPTISSDPTYLQTFVYGNVLANLGTVNGPTVHWNEDQGGGLIGRAELGGKLYFYDNTLAVASDQNVMYKFSVFSVGIGGGSCGTSTPGVIDVRNNIFANLPSATATTASEMDWGACGIENFVFGPNWVSPGTNLVFSGSAPYSGIATGLANLVSPAGNDPGFVNFAAGDFHLTAVSSAGGMGGALAAAVTANSLGLDLTPTQQYANASHTIPRLASGPGSDAGAFQRAAACTPGLVSAVDFLPAVQAASTFPISWHLVSASAAVQSYTLWVSDNGAPFSALPPTPLTQTSFIGAPGHQYGFFSIAQDVTNGVECAKSAAEAGTMVVLASSCAGNATAQFTITRGAFRLNAATGRFTQTVTVSKSSAGVLSGPFALALDGLTPGVSLYQAAGVTDCAAPAGSPYALISPGTPTWSTGQNVTILLEFVNPSKGGIIYTPRVLQSGTSR